MRYAPSSPEVSQREVVDTQIQATQDLITGVLERRDSGRDRLALDVVEAKGLEQTLIF